jgi:hypothetical protein
MKGQTGTNWGETACTASIKVGQALTAWKHFQQRQVSLHDDLPTFHQLAASTKSLHHVIGSIYTSHLAKEAKWCTATRHFLPLI